MTRSRRSANRARTPVPASESVMAGGFPGALGASVLVMPQEELLKGRRPAGECPRARAGQGAQQGREGRVVNLAAEPAGTSRRFPGDSVVDAGQPREVDGAIRLGVDGGPGEVPQLG